MRQRRLQASAVLAALTLLVAGGCVRERVVERDAPSGTSAPSDDKKSSSDDKSGGASSPTKDLGKVVATGNTSDGDTTVRVDLYELKRTGSVLIVNIGVTNTSPEGTGDKNWQVSNFFDDGESNSPDPALNTRSSLDGVFLIDEANRKKYPVARDATKRCVCSSDLGSTFVGRGQTVTLSATLGAPPKEVKVVNVSIPHVATFINVPLD
jgi:hypothetical protein